MTTISVMIELVEVRCRCGWFVCSAPKGTPVRRGQCPECKQPIVITAGDRVRPQVPSRYAHEPPFSRERYAERVI